MSTLEAFYPLYKKEIEWEEIGAGFHMAPLELGNGDARDRDSYLMKFAPSLESGLTLCEDPIKLRVLQGRVRFVVKTDIKNSKNEKIRVRRKKGELTVGDTLKIKRGQHFILDNLGTGEADVAIIFCDVFTY